MPYKGAAKASEGSAQSDNQRHKAFALSPPMSVWGRLMRDVMDGLEVHLGGSVSETQRMAAELERTYGHRPQLDAPAPKPYRQSRRGGPTDDGGRRPSPLKSHLRAYGRAYRRSRS
jgi:hypothetical protein